MASLSLALALTPLPVVLGASRCRADAFFTYGIGSRALSMGGAYTAVADDFSAPFYNPAAGAFSDRILLGAGYLHTRLDLDSNVSFLDPPDVDGVAVGMLIPLPLGGFLERRLALGFALFVPMEKVLELLAAKPDEPNFLLLQNVGQNLVTLASLSVRLTDHLAVGGGVSLFNDTEGTTEAFLSPEGRIEPDVNQGLATSFTPHLGIEFLPSVLWERLEGLKVAFTFRDSFVLRYDVPVLAQLGPVPLDVGVASSALFTPRQLTLGAAYAVSGDLLLAAEVSRSLWSEFPDPTLSIEVEVDIPVIDVQFKDSEPMPVDFRDTTTPRVGLEWRAWGAGDFDLFLRGGYAFEPSPVPAQKGIANILDNDRHVLAAGAGVTVTNLLDELGTFPVSVDLHFQYHLLVERSARKDESVPEENPGAPRVGSGGNLFSYGVTFSTRVPPLR